MPKDNKNFFEKKIDAMCSSDNEYGITLISLDEDRRKRMEPYPTPNLINQKSDQLF